MARIKKGDTVKLISGANKGQTGKVQAILSKKNAALVEGLGNRTRHIRPNQFMPRGGTKDIQVPVSLNKLALVVDEKDAKSSRVGFEKDDDGNKIRVARQLNNKEIK